MNNTKLMQLEDALRLSKERWRKADSEAAKSKDEYKKAFDDFWVATLARDTTEAEEKDAIDFSGAEKPTHLAGMEILYRDGRIVIGGHTLYKPDLRNIIAGHINHIYGWEIIHRSASVLIGDAYATHDHLQRIHDAIEDVV